MKKLLSLSLALILFAAVFAGCGSSSKDVYLSESNIQMSVGDTHNLQLKDGDGNILTRKITWTSSDNSIAMVSDGTVSAKKSGTVTISANSENGPTANCEVVISEKKITKINLNPQATALNVGKAVQIKATFTPVDATDTALTWSSSDESIAVVNSEGYVTGIKGGIVNVVCKSGDVEASCTVTVKEQATQPPTQAATVPQAITAPPATKSDSDNSAKIILYGHFNPYYTYRSGDFIFPESSIRLLSASEVSSKLGSMSGSPVSGSFAQDAINEIYARNGYIFKSSSLLSYYETKLWYYEDSDFAIDDLNSTEKANIKLLDQYR